MGLPFVFIAWENVRKYCRKNQKQGIQEDSGRIFYNTFRNEGVKIWYTYH